MKAVKVDILNTDVKSNLIEHSRTTGFTNEKIITIVENLDTFDRKDIIDVCSFFSKKKTLWDKNKGTWSRRCNTFFITTENLKDRSISKFLQKVQCPVLKLDEGVKLQLLEKNDVQTQDMDQFEDLSAHTMNTLFPKYLKSVMKSSNSTIPYHFLMKLHQYLPNLRGVNLGVLVESLSNIDTHSPGTSANALIRAVLKLFSSSISCKLSRPSLNYLHTTINQKRLSKYIYDQNLFLTKLCTQRS
jgi:hypothetical protein